MSDLAADVVLSYNGVTWPNSLASRVSGTPVYDSAGRVVTHVVYMLTAEAVFHVPFAPGNDVTDTSETLRVALTKPGGQLVYTGAGNDFGINTTDADVRWGPRPKLLTFTPVGKQQAVKVAWQVEVAITECDPQGQRGIPPGSRRHPMEFCYSVDFAVDQSGYTRRTYSGHVVIAQTRRGVSSREVPDEPDRLREDITPQIPTGFRRESATFNLSEDRRTLRFTFIDAQMPAQNYPPPGVVVASASHDMGTQNLSMIQWRGNIRAEYELAPGVPRGDTALHFQALVSDRLEAHKAIVAQRANPLLTNPPPWLGNLLNNVAVKTIVIPTSATISEPEIYGRRAAAYTFSYLLTLPPWAIAQAASFGGLFRPVPDSDWSRWSASMDDLQVGTPRGHAQMRYYALDDKLVDLCIALPIAAGNPLQKQNNTPEFGGSKVPVPVPVPQERGGLGGGILKPAAFDELKPANSWLDFHNELIVEEEDDCVEVRQLPTAPVRQVRGRQFGPTQPGGGYAVPYADAPASVIQLRGKPVVALVLQGRGLRAGFDIAPPELETVGGVTPVLANRAGVEYWRTSVVANLGYPVVAAQWRMRWIMPTLPTNRLASPQNPMLGQALPGGGKEEFGGTFVR